MISCTDNRKGGDTFTEQETGQGTISNDDIRLFSISRTEDKENEP
jgi:hypothetical protein